MIRIVLSITVFLTLTLLQLAFFASLPGVLALSPIVFAASVYMLQHHGLIDGLWWMVGFGFQLDVLGLSPIPPITLSFLVAGIVALYASKDLFSNRSFYGIAGCGLLAFAAFSATQGITAVLIQLFTDTSIFWRLYLYDIMAKAALLIVLLGGLFPFAGIVRKVLRFVMPRSSYRETF